MNTDVIGWVIGAMINYYSGDARRINHFLKVYGFAKAIGELEKLDRVTQDILELTAITHDIGIKNSESKYDSTSGEYQQTEGPHEAKKLLESLDCDISPAIISRVCWLISRHHTYMDIQGLDYQILVEADFLVNIHEDGLSRDTVINIGKKLFKTKTGLEFLSRLYLN